MSVSSEWVYQQVTKGPLAFIPKLENQVIRKCAVI